MADLTTRLTSYIVCDDAAEDWRAKIWSKFVFVLRHNAEDALAISIRCIGMENCDDGKHNSSHKSPWAGSWLSKLGIDIALLVLNIVLNI